MSKPEEGAASFMKLVVVPLRGKFKGKFGWVLRTDEFAVQCLRTFPSAEAAQADALVFAEAESVEAPH